MWWTERLGALIINCMKSLVALAVVAMSVAIVPETKPAPDLSGSWYATSEVIYNGTEVLTVPWRDYDWTISEQEIEFEALYWCGSLEKDRFRYHLNAQHSPMWLDLVSKKHVEIGIIKLEKDTLTWHRGKRVPLEEWKRANGNVAGRPKDFKITRTAGTSVIVLVRKSK
jgi:hypothetical protein